MRRERSHLKEYVVSTSTDGFELKYFKTTTQGEDDALNFYGVFVEKHLDGRLIEEMDSGSLTEDAEEILKIIDQLEDRRVVPYSLCETLDEMISKKEMVS